MEDLCLYLRILIIHFPFQAKTSLLCRFFAKPRKVKFVLVGSIVFYAHSLQFAGFNEITVTTFQCRRK